MSEPTGIDFILAGGSRTGLGHVVRCATLASEAIRRGRSIRAFIDGDATACEQWRRLTGSADIYPWESWRAAPGFEIAALDYPGEKSDWLDRLEPAGRLALVIDDARCSERAAWTLLPALHHAISAHADPVANTKVLAGPRYAILSRAHLDQPPIPRSDRKSLLLSLGGADPLGVTPRVAPLVTRALEAAGPDHGIEDRDVVLGPAFQDPDGSTAERLRETGWRVHQSLDAPAMARRMASARMAIIGFGTSLCELAWHRTPFLSLTHHEHDGIPARDLEANGIGRSLGLTTRLDPERIVRRVRKALDDQRWQTESLERAARLIEGGHGAARVIERLRVDDDTGSDRRPTPAPTIRALRNRSSPSA